MATGSTTTVMGDTTMARVSRTTGSTMAAMGGTTTLHDDGYVPHDDGDGQQDDERHNVGTGRHGNGRPGNKTMGGTTTARGSMAWRRAAR